MDDEKTDIDEYLAYLAKYVDCADNLAEYRASAANRILEVIETETLHERGIVDFRNHRFLRMNIVSPAKIGLLISLAGSEDQRISSKSRELLSAIMFGILNGDLMYGTDPRSPWPAEDVLKDKSFQDAIMKMRDFASQDMPESPKPAPQAKTETPAKEPSDLPLPKKRRAIQPGHGVAGTEKQKPITSKGK